MGTEKQRDNAAGIQRHRYLEVLHEFTMRQASLRSVDDICWNIAKTAIGELGFVDCVVYLMNETRSHLVQRAAHGDKNPIEREILDPIVIPVGEGIVGSVAATGKLEWVNDTRVDRRYILDDSFRCAELLSRSSWRERSLCLIQSTPKRTFSPTKMSNFLLLLLRSHRPEFTQRSRWNGLNSKRGAYSGSARC